ncbi:mitotic checkpoint serine/threonine-protein kinase BUB1 isoform X3 [Nerophis lumbriciformis]|uniref:mitotic checkpoint serine/threonine-protein kinase BUB1 isoform X3 n=1 Tax=Nerophis lumbriciformis TaxID=546530 RepID=UPI002AE0162E|nr:mitotic checkpoint serine/threonine-protein kinase BUB1-like isoform X3 [Nerophis lumbriciformis]
MEENTDVFYLKTQKNQARPAETGLHKYRHFQSRRSSQETASGGGQLPLKDSQLTNQMSSDSLHAEAAVDCQANANPYITVTMLSRSETSAILRHRPVSQVTQVSQYLKDALLCEDSELCFEEVRANKYQKQFQTKSCKTSAELKEDKTPAEERVAGENPDLHQEDIGGCHVFPCRSSAGFVHESSVLPEPSQRADSNTCSSQELHHHVPIVDDQSVTVSKDTSGFRNEIAESEETLHASQGGTTDVCDMTPNNSVGSTRVLPSPTVNTREALDVIMGMFQAPSNNISSFFVTDGPLDEATSTDGSSQLANMSASQPFTVYQDAADKENVMAASEAHRSKRARCLVELPPSNWKKLSDSPQNKTPDVTTMWGAPANAISCLAACPNSTADFAVSAHCMSTPFTHKVPVNIFQDAADECDATQTDENAFIRHQHKLSPIIEQSPDDKPSDTAVGEHVTSSVSQCTIVGELPTANVHRHLTTSSTTVMQPPPPAVLSFRDQTLGPFDSSQTSGLVGGVSTTSSTTVMQPPPPAVLSFRDQTLGPFDSSRTSGLVGGVSTDLQSCAEPAFVGEPFSIVDDFRQGCHLPVTSDQPLIRSPAPPAQPNVDAFPSTGRGLDVCKSPEPPRDVSINLTPLASSDEHMVSPEKDPSPQSKLSLLVSDPWSSDLIAELLLKMTSPLTSHPRCHSWQHKIPNISPKMSVSVGNSSLRVDRILGQGAFATVYQASHTESCAKMVLKVQKPANPWEFYINTQLDARLAPQVRHLYGRVYSAHLFTNGSVLLSELHPYGTLLNAVNLYKQLADKVMPQPLVIYFTVCILRMMEELHAACIIHADIKPDNFMLAHRFLENNKFECEDFEHGLVLIDWGQSIDMKCFRECTAFTAKCLTSGFQCTEMLSSKPWNYQTDYFGIAGTVHCMLFGSYMKVVNEDGVWRTTAMFRRNPHSEMWLSLFHTLLNVPDCNPLASLSALRRRLASVLEDNYGSKMASLKSRLVVNLLESAKATRR